MRQIVTLTRSDAPNAFLQGVLCALCMLVFLPVWSQSEFCLEGTVWDATLGGCIPEGSCAVEGDFNGDGLVGTGDLLAFLTLFGNQYQDSDGDGLCDALDDCNGVVDDCGVCNGPGAIYDCGCEPCPPEEGECGAPVSYQGYDYATVQIGDQCWFAENLRSENYENGDSIPTGLTFNEWYYTTSGASVVYGEVGGYCSTNNSPDIDACDPALSLNEYGRLYNWYAVDDARGLCPIGWHVPTDGEWMSMEMALGMSEAEVNSMGFRGTDQGMQMKTTFGWRDDGNGTNSTGFSGLPGGAFNVPAIDPDEQFSFNAGSVGSWWSSSPNGYGAVDRNLVFTNGRVSRNSAPLEFCLSVRCVRDNASCANDADADGICDDEDDCVGALDECGVCNGPGAIYDCGCEECPSIEGCGDPIGYQGYNYATIQIGEQCWFAENLRSENYENGDAIPAGLSDSDWQTTTFGAVAVYGEDAGCDDYSPDIDACDPVQSLNEYGRLYNWYAVDDARGLCPSGWHVPTDGEWTVMTDHLGGESIAGGQMKTDYGWYSGGNGANSSGFSGLPGGLRYYDGLFYFAGNYGYWWSSSPSGSIAWFRYLIDSNESVSRSSDYHFPQSGFSVRCVRDAE